MPKKSFKDNTDHLDAFFTPKEDTFNEDTSKGDTPNEDTSKEASIKIREAKSVESPAPYRLNITLRPEHREHLKEASWKARKSMSQYLSDLIEADIGKR